MGKWTKPREGVIKKTQCFKRAQKTTCKPHERHPKLGIGHKKLDKYKHYKQESLGKGINRNKEYTKPREGVTKQQPIVQESPENNLKTTQNRNKT